MKRSPHLVPYEKVDPRIKQANRDTASETIRTLMIYGYVLEPPSTEVDEGLSKELEALKQNTRTFRAEKPYAVSSGKWWVQGSLIDLSDILNSKTWQFSGITSLKWCPLDIWKLVGWTLPHPQIVPSAQMSSHLALMGIWWKSGIKAPTPMESPGTLETLLAVF